MFGFHNVPQNHNALHINNDRRDAPRASFHFFGLQIRIIQQARDYKSRATAKNLFS